MKSKFFIFLLLFIIFYFYISMPIALAEETISQSVKITAQSEFSTWKKVFSLMIYGSVIAPTVLGGAVSFVYGTPLVATVSNIFWTSTITSSISGLTFIILSNCGVLISPSLMFPFIYMITILGYCSAFNIIQEPILAFMINYLFWNTFNIITSNILPADVINIILSGNLLGLLVGSAHGIVNPLIFNDSGYAKPSLAFNIFLGTWLIINTLLITDNYNELIFLIGTGMISGHFSNFFFSYGIYGLKYFIFSYFFKKFNIFKENLDIKVDDCLIESNINEFNFFEYYIYILFYFIKFIIKLFMGH